ncbi:MAG: hypothetical protein ACKVIO_00030 [Phycisphaerales bacterium]|jgi:hypothetical protein
MPNKKEFKLQKGVDYSEKMPYILTMTFTDLPADELAELDAAIAAEQADATDQQIEENE